MKNLLLGLLPLLFLSNTFAAEGMPTGFYIGGSYLMSETDEKVSVNETVNAGDIRVDANTVIHSVTVDEIFTDDDDSGFRAFVGYRPHPYFALELSYSDLGKHDVEVKGSIRASVSGAATQNYPVTEKIGSIEFDEALQVSLLANTPLIMNRASFFAKLGYGQVDFSVRALGGKESEKETTPVLGAGILFNLTDQFALRAEYEYWDDLGDDSSIDVWLLGVQFQPFKR